MREQGIVTKTVSGNIVEVACQKTESCAKCGLCHEAAEGMLAIEAINAVGAKLNDTVEIEIPSVEMIKGSIVIFLLPIFFLMVGYLIGYKIGQETFGIISALLFAASSLLVIKWYDKNAQQKQALRATITKVISPR
ncbi:MAG: SoxR reducing system RseC family protein [Candidatus Margulisbacteria bacterium]|nr:SoxR reducing system RseC family protein [Candidatus Margulisiibacteriota bacterium]